MTELSFFFGWTVPLMSSGDLPPWRLHPWLHAGQIPNLVSCESEITFFCELSQLVESRCACVCMFEMFKHGCVRASFLMVVLVGLYCCICSLWQWDLVIYLSSPALFLSLLLLHFFSLTLLLLFSFQLYGHAICSPGSGPHHEEAEVKWSHHHIPLLPASKRPEGRFPYYLLDSFTYIDTFSSQVITPLYISFNQRASGSARVCVT